MEEYPFYFSRRFFSGNEVNFMWRFRNKPFIIFLLLVLMFVNQGCGGGTSTGTVSGKVIFGVQPAGFPILNNYLVIPLFHIPPVSKSVAANTGKIIRFRPGLAESQIARIVAAMGGKLKYRMYGFIDTYVVDIASSSLKLSGYGSEIESVEDNLPLYASAIPNDSLYGCQWGCRMMYFAEGWDVQKGESNIPPVIVAVLDTGVNLTHEDLVSNLITPTPTDQCNFTVDMTDPKATNPSDDNGHGTHVAGIISAVSNNSIGVAGMAWNVKILPVKVLDSAGNGDYAGVSSGIKYAVDQGAKVINLSMGGPAPYTIPSVFIEAYNYAAAHNVTIVAAAGNENGPVNFPASYSGVIAVAALGPDGLRAPYSNFGPQITVCAPGGAGTVTDKYSQAIVSTYNNPANSYAYMCGTSMATPHISGLVALLYSQNPAITHAQARDRLRQFTIDKGAPGFDNDYGYGMPDAYAVLSGKAIRLSETAVYVVSAEKAVETFQTPDGLGNYTLSGVNPGSKYICAFLDKNRNGQVDTGDLFGYQSVTVQSGLTVTNLNITLTDALITPAPSLAAFLQAVLP